MEGRLVLKNCSVFRSDGRIRRGMAVVIEGSKISLVAPDADVPILPGDWAVSCRGRLVTPGLVDCHTHLVTSQLVPISGELLLKPPATRGQLQHRLASALTAAEVEVLTAFALGRAARAGVTLAVEHLSCPNDVLDALRAQARAAERIGVRLANSHASSSLGGSAAGVTQVELNAEYVATQQGELVRPALGFHASYACDDELLRRLGHHREATGAGVHFHLAESEEDLRLTYDRDGKRIVHRLAEHGVLGARSVAAYARAIDRNESEQLSRTRTLVALSPRMNLASEPGGGGLEAVFAHHNLIGLGTSGMGLLWGELISAFSAVVQIARHGRLLDPDGFMAQLLVSGPAELCSALYGAPSGTIDAGSLADVVVYDHVPAQETDDGLAPHLLLQLGQVRVAWTIAHGRVLVREGQLLSHDYLELAAEAARAAESVWARVAPA